MGLCRLLNTQSQKSPSRRSLYANSPIPRHSASSILLMRHGSCPNEFWFCKRIQSACERHETTSSLFFWLSERRGINKTHPFPTCRTDCLLRLGPHSRQIGARRGQGEKNRGRRPESFRVHDEAGMREEEAARVASLTITRGK